MIDLTEYKAIIFDLGGVILNIDYNRPIEAFKKLGVQDFHAHYQKKGQSELFDLLETGKISNQRFIETLKSQLNLLHTPCQQITAAWNSILLDFPKHRLELLLQLKSKITTFLLSNTNAIHIKAFHEILEQTHGHKDLSAFFHKVYYSSDIKLRKPNKEAFEYILNAHDLKANQVLFIDDSIQHVQGARTVGIKAIHLNGDLDMSTLFKAFV